jgi:WD40 repeat protein
LSRVRRVGPSRSDGDRDLERAAGAAIGAPLVPHGSVTALDLGSGGKHVLTVGTDGNVRIWDGTAAGPCATFCAHAERIGGVAFSPDGQAIVTTSVKEARLWAVPTGKLLAKLPHATNVTAFSSDSRFVATGGWDRGAQVWSVATGQPVGPRLKHPKPVMVVALSPDGGTVMIGGEDATARLWSVAEGNAIGPPLVHRNNLSAAAFSRDGRTLLTGAMDATVRLWDTATGKPRLPELPQGRAIDGAVFGLHGRTFAALSRDGVVRLGR